MRFRNWAWLLCGVAVLLAGQSREATPGHPLNPPGSVRPHLDRLTSDVTARLADDGHSEASVLRKNYIDHFIFQKMERDGVRHARLSSDEEFLRRVSLDLTGRIPEPQTIKDFVRDKHPDKRERLIDELTDTTFEPETFDHPSFPFIDRWTYFFCDLFENTLDQVGGKGRNLFWDHINAALLLNASYRDLVVEMLTATARSNWLSGPSNFLARYHADDADGLGVNHEDTIEDIAISATKSFLGINLECIACHDGQGHLEQINLWLSRKKREEFWRHASFFGSLRIYRAFGIGQEFVVTKDAHRFDLSYPSVKRVPRHGRVDTTPTFLLTEETARPGEDPQQAFARILTAHPQFARATVNLVWAELMGVGIVDPPLEFDMDRQDPTNPPPDPWQIQPTHPELLDALAEDFVQRDYDLRYLVKLIAKSSTYQLSSRFDGQWQPEHASYFARRYVRRLSAEQLYDAISDATGVYKDIPISETNRTVNRAMQSRGPQDFGGKELRTEKAFLAAFGLSNRDQGVKSLDSSVAQAALMLNGKLVQERVGAEKGKLQALLCAKPLKDNATIVDELFLATLGRFPTKDEMRVGSERLERDREAGAEDLLMSLLNQYEFMFNH